MKKLNFVAVLGLLLAFVLPTTVFGNVDTESYYTYVINPGDNLVRIAESFCTPVQKLIELNKLSNPNMIYVGQELKVRTAETLAKPVIYTVQPSDTMSKIAQKNGLTVTDIVKANKLQNPNILYIGQKIVIPVKLSQPAAGEVKNVSIVQTVQNTYIMYIVKAGDTLFKIARNNNTTVDALIKSNSLDPNKYLFMGQKLFIPLTSCNVSGQPVI